jgi:hypothetical protein
MKRLEIVGAGSLLLLVLGTACGASSQAGKESATAGDPASAASAEPQEPTAAGQGIDVGVQYEDKGDKERADRTPPPTPTYKPTNKNKKNVN